VTAADTESLGRLAEELARRGMAVTLAPDASRPVLEVRNPGISMMSERVTAASGWYWWPWAERIAAVDDIGLAADVVLKVLA
jgi:hypothetical protein